MWYECENGNSARPADVDTTSSQVYVYVRRNFEFIPEHTEGETVIPGHYRWEETKIPKDAWTICEQVIAQSDELDTLTEILYTMMGVNTDDEPED